MRMGKIRSTSLCRRLPAKPYCHDTVLQINTYTVQGYSKFHIQLLLVDTNHAVAKEKELKPLWVKSRLQKLSCTAVLLFILSTIHNNKGEWFFWYVSLTAIHTMWSLRSNLCHTQQPSTASTNPSSVYLNSRLSTFLVSLPSTFSSPFLWSK